MNGRINILLHGEPDRVVDELFSGMAGERSDLVPECLRLALINAMQRIDRLEKLVAELRGDNAR